MKISQATDKQIKEIIDDVLAGVYLFIGADNEDDMLVSQKVTNIDRHGEEVQVQLVLTGIINEETAATFTLTDESVDFNGSIPTDDVAGLEVVYQEALDSVLSKEPGDGD